MASCELIHKVFVIVLELTYFVWTHFIERYFSHIMLEFIVTILDYSPINAVLHLSINDNVVTNEGWFPTQRDPFDNDLEIWSNTYYP
jgi:hypothetical protein